MSDPASSARLVNRNLIPFNSAQIGSVASYQPSSPKAIAAFKAVLDRAHLPATVRLTRGRDIQAACGQLAATASA
jgi:23S rRNA (adenine2503-C2)-methyltransferase